MKNNFKYNIGEEVNGLIIIDQTRDEKYNYKTYLVQSIKFPDAPQYYMFETSLAKGRGDGYLAGGGRIYEGNSLYSKKEYRKYLVDVEYAKTIAPSYSKKIKMKCPHCNKEKMISPHTLLKQGFSCGMCSKNISYPELFIIAYGEVKNLNLKHQVIFDDLKDKRFDFYNEKIGAIETHGRQHYTDSGFMNYGDTIKSDKIKRKYCKENNIKLIELDCRESTFEFIKNSINECKYLPSILKEDEDKILKAIEKNKRYPIKDIVELYKNEKTTYEIAELYNLSHATIGNILKRNNIELRDAIKQRRRKVKCLTTNNIFESIAEASNYFGVARSSIRKACNDNAKSAGKHPKTKEKLYWCYI